jgi:hypothetical protein
MISVTSQRIIGCLVAHPEPAQVCRRFNQCSTVFSASNFFLCRYMPSIPFSLIAGPFESGNKEPKIVFNRTTRHQQTMHEEVFDKLLYREFSKLQVCDRLITCSAEFLFQNDRVHSCDSWSNTTRLRMMNWGQRSTEPKVCPLLSKLQPSGLDWAGRSSQTLKLPTLQLPESVLVLQMRRILLHE